MKILFKIKLLTIISISFFSFNSIAQSTLGKWKVYSGTIVNNLRVEKFNDKKIINTLSFPRSGEIQFNAPLYCGDGDVASYYAGKTEEAYFGKKNTNPVKIVIGYWVNPDSPPTVSSPLDESVPVLPTTTLPTPETWFSIGYGDLPSKGSTTSLTAAGSSSAPSAGGILLKEQFQKLLKQFKNSPKLAYYRIRMAALACNEFTDSRGVPSDLTQQGPTAAEIAETLIDWEPSATSALSSSLTISVSTSSSGLNLNIFSGPSFSNTYQQQAHSVRSLSKPSSTATNGQVRNSIAGTLNGVSNLISECSSKLNQPTKKYWWESLPLELTCQKLNLPMLQSLVTQIRADGYADAALYSQNFENLRDQIVILLRKAAYTEMAQESLQSKSDADLPKNKITCIPINEAKTAYESPFINTVLAGLGVDLQMSPSSTTAVIAGPVGENPHPESGYAVGQYERYQNSNVPTLYMNRSDEQSTDFGVTLETKKEYTFSLESGLLFQMNLRGIGCSDGIGYCQNQKINKKETKI